MTPREVLLAHGASGAAATLAHPSVHAPGRLPVSAVPFGTWPSAASTRSGVIGRSGTRTPIAFATAFAIAAAVLLVSAAAFTGMYRRPSPDVAG